MLYEEMSRHYTLCKEFCSDPSSAVLFDFFPSATPSLLLYWKKQWTINLYSLSSSHTQYCRPLYSVFSCLFFRQKNTNLLSCSFYKSCSMYLIILVAFFQYLSISTVCFLRGSRLGLCSSIIILSVVVFITFQSFLTISFLFNHCWALRWCFHRDIYYNTIYYNMKNSFLHDCQLKDHQCMIKLG